MSLGYILGKASAKALNTSLNVPLVMTLSVLPDMDILFQHLNGLGRIIPHRGPFHSVLIMLIVFIPVFAVYRKKALPYFIALVSHPLIGDYFTGGNLQLFWPITSQTYGIAGSIYSPENIGLELMLFLSSIALLVVTRDLFTLFKPRLSNLILAIPTFTVLLPIFLSFPLQVPVPLILPHLTFMILFIVAIIVTLVGILRRRKVR